MFERFTDRARRVLVLAQEEARLLNHTFIGTEHLLLGLVHEEEGIAAQALRSLGISLEAVREQVKETIGTSSTRSPGSPPFTPRAKKVMELSLREAMQLGHAHIGPEHLLLGLVREGEGVGAQVLVSLGTDLGRVRQQVIHLMAGHGGPRPNELPDLPEPRAGFVRQQGGSVPPWLRCALCGRSLWETAHVVVGPGGRACEECVRAGAGLLEHAGPEQRELVLPPEVSGQPPDDAAVSAITAAVTGAFGPDAAPSTWATTVEDPEHFVPLLEHLLRRWGRPEAVRVAEVGFVNPQLAYVRFQLEFEGSRGTDVAGQLRRHEDRWMVTRETMVEVLARQGIDVPPD